ncbi:1645_t:CDS:2 [Racocetra fulgida]|uniref:1645_t:CDS:1 n=1 Tax=Racocetra fulgida TaxID=60492 RepID=A0A9N8ZW62_9GLOM|nr:1645_t:CDS:2 [Racocetra fulgida]
MSESTISTYRYECIPFDNDDNTFKYHFIYANDNKLNYTEFINLLCSEDDRFLDTLINALNDATDKLSAYLWECPPVSQESKNNHFEFVVTKSKALSYMKQDCSSFNDKLNSFSNLGKDATLIVPMPCHKLDYKNLSNFTKKAPKDQQIKFWQEVANKLSESLEIGTPRPRWLSTHGLGVPYLHVRIDNKPKYYSYLPFKQFRFGKNNWELDQSKNVHSNNKKTTLSSYRKDDQQNPTKIGSKAEPNVDPNVDLKIVPKIDLKNDSKIRPIARLPSIQSRTGQKIKLCKLKRKWKFDKLSRKWNSIQSKTGRKMELHKLKRKRKLYKLTRKWKLDTKKKIQA